MTATATPAIHESTREFGLSVETVADCHAALESLLEDSYGILVAGLAAPDGSEITSIRRSRREAFSTGKIAALAGSLASLGSALTLETDQGVCRSLIVDADEGRTLILTIPGQRRRFSLFVTATDGTLPGQLILNAHKCADALAKVLEPQPAGRAA